MKRTNLKSLDNYKTCYSYFRKTASLKVICKNAVSEIFGYCFRTSWLTVTLVRDRISTGANLGDIFNAMLEISSCG